MDESERLKLFYFGGKRRSMICPYCKNETNDKLRFCNTCGKRIPFCKNCGKPILFKVNQCINCGEPIQPLEVSKLPEPNEEQLKMLEEKFNKRKAEEESLEEEQRRIEREQQIKQQQRELKIKRTKKLLKKIALITVGIVVLFIGIILFLNNDSEQSLDETPAVKSSKASSESVSTTYEESTSIVETVSAKSIEKIKKAYSTVQSEYKNGDYKKIVAEEGIVAYYKKDELKMIIASSGVNGINYKRSYYYSKNAPSFANYASKDFLEIYFEDGNIIRIRAGEDAKNRKNAIDYDNEEGWASWPQVITNDIKSLMKKVEEAKNYYDVAGGEYVLPQSSVAFISRSDLKGFGKEKCRIARNEIYARKGRKFKDPKLQAYFDSMSWYHGTIESDDFKDSMLNEYEKKNVDVIVLYEKDKGYR